MTPRARFIAAAGGLLWACLLISCAAPLKDPRGLAVSRGELPPAVTPPATLQADLGLWAHEAGSLTLSSRLYAQPAQQYRLDIFGLLTPVAATWLWRGEGEGWTLVRHDTREVLTGTGTALTLKGTPLNLPDVHAVLGFLWGEPLPGFTGQGFVDSLGVLHWGYGGKRWTARFEAATGLCVEAASDDLVLRYARHRLMGGRVIPGELQVILEGRRVLTVHVKERVESPEWKKDPFLLTVPVAYDSVRLGP